MFAKIFEQIFDSSIANDYKVRHFFMDLLVLADAEGHVDMTREAISARTRIPLEDVVAMMTVLASPDLQSRTPDCEGRRVELLDEHRDWGWRIVNYEYFRSIASEENRKAKQRERFMRWKAKQKTPANGALTPANGAQTANNASNAMQKQRHKQMQKQNQEAYKDGRFAPPTIAEVKLQCAKIGLPESEADGFIAHHEARGWMLGRVKMKSWPAALTTWKMNYHKWGSDRRTPNGRLTREAEESGLHTTF